MSFRIAMLLSLAGTLCVRTAPAQQSRWAMLRDDVDHMAGDILHVWTSPLRADASDLAGLAGVAGGAVLIGIFDDEIHDWIRENPESLPVRAVGPMRQSRPLSMMGYTSYLVTLSAGIYAVGLAFESEALREAGIGCITSDISNTLARHLLARLLGRLRPQFTRDPYIIEPLAWGDWEMRSFPAGHAANIMACTTFWTRNFDMGVVEPLLYVLATGISLGRLVDHAHWTSDTAFGMVFGWAVGRSVAGRFADRGGPVGDAAAFVGGAPKPVLTFQWTIRF